MIQVRVDLWIWCIFNVSSYCAKYCPLFCCCGCLVYTIFTLERFILYLENRNALYLFPDTFFEFSLFPSAAVAPSALFHSVFHQNEPIFIFSNLLSLFNLTIGIINGHLIVLPQKAIWRVSLSWNSATFCDRILSKATAQEIYQPHRSCSV